MLIVKHLENTEKYKMKIKNCFQFYQDKQALIFGCIFSSPPPIYLCLCMLSLPFLFFEYKIGGGWFCASKILLMSSFGWP